MDFLDWYNLTQLTANSAVPAESFNSESTAVGENGIRKRKSGTTTGGKRTHEDQSSSLACKICQKSFTVSASLSRHMVTHSGNTHPYSCEECDMKFTQKSSLLSHVKDKHESAVIYPCRKCEVTLMSRARLKSHVRKEHGPKIIGPEFRWACPEPGCERNFLLQRNLENHIKEFHVRGTSEDGTEGPVLRNKCPICQKSFIYACNLKKHMEVHTTARVQCPECPHKFRCDRLEVHITAKHRREKKYKSRFCDRAFVGHSQRNRHDAIHREKGICRPPISSQQPAPLLAGPPLEIPEVRLEINVNDVLDLEKKKSGVIACKTCGKEFKDNSSLKRHQLVHAELRLLKCPSCTVLFRWKKNLIEHIDIAHRGKNKYRSRFCTMTFKSTRARSVHEKDHTDNGKCVDLRPEEEKETIFYCQLCTGKQTFWRKELFRLHRRTAHPDLQIQAKKLELKTLEVVNGAGISTLKSYTEQQTWYSCNKCGYASRDLELIRRHNLSLCGTKEYSPEPGSTEQTTRRFNNEIQMSYDTDIPEIIIKEEPVELAEDLIPIPDDLDLLTYPEQPVLKLDLAYTEGNAEEYEHDSFNLPCDSPPASPPSPAPEEDEDYILPDMNIPRKIKPNKPKINRSPSHSTAVPKIKQKQKIKRKRPTSSSPNFAYHIVNGKRIRIGDWEKEFMDIITLEGKTYFQCKSCSKYFPLKRALQKHVRIHKNKGINPGLERMKVGDWEKEFMAIITLKGKPHFKCKLCSQAFPLKRGLQKHVRIHTSRGEFVYTKEDRTTPREQESLYAPADGAWIRKDVQGFRIGEWEGKYMKFTEGEQNPFQCAECGKAFKDKNFLRLHVKRAHMEDWKEYEKQRKLLKRQQLQEKGDPRPWKCTLCPKTYPINAKLKEHMVSHSERTIPCPTCKKMFKSEYQMRKHSLIHGPRERKYLCSLCGYAAMSSSSLYIHARYHKEKQFQCDVAGCDFRAMMKADLIYHQRRHTGERPFLCDQCPYAGISRPALKIHMAVHLPNQNTRTKRARKPASFPCKTCGKTFTSVGSMRTHEYIQHTSQSDKPAAYSCSICGKSFTQYTNANAHVRLRHELIDSEGNRARPASFVRVDESQRPPSLISRLGRVSLYKRSSDLRD